MAKESKLRGGRTPADHTKCQQELREALNALAASESAGRLSTAEIARLTKELERLGREVRVEREGGGVWRKRGEEAEAFMAKAGSGGDGGASAAASAAARAAAELDALQATHAKEVGRVREAHAQELREVEARAARRCSDLEGSLQERERELAAALAQAESGALSSTLAEQRRAEASEAALARLRAELEGLRTAQALDLDRVTAEGARLLKLERESWQKIVEGMEFSSRRASEVADAGAAKARAELDALRSHHDAEIGKVREEGGKGGGLLMLFWLGCIAL